MKRLFLIIMMLPLYLSNWAQISFKTGDAEFDTDLNTINAKAKVEFGSFKAEMAGTYNIEEKKIDYMHIDMSMEPAEIYLALEIGRISNRPVDEVIEVYRVNKSKGWGFIAKKMGIKPGSDEFHALKNNTQKKSNSSKAPSKDKNKKSSRGKRK